MMEGSNRFPFPAFIDIYWWSILRIWCQFGVIALGSMPECCTVLINLLNVLIIEQFAESWPLLVINFQTFQDQSFERRRKTAFQMVPVHRNLHFLLQLCLGLTVAERRLSMQHFKEKHAKGPDIRFRTIDIANQSFRSHVSRRTDAHVLELSLAMCSKPKISNLRLPFREKYIRSLDISMHNAHRLQIQQSLKDILNDSVGFIHIILIPEMPLPYSFRKIAVLAQLIDTVTVIGSPEVLNAWDYIGMLQPFDNVELLPK